MRIPEGGEKERGTPNVSEFWPRSKILNLNNQHHHSSSLCSTSAVLAMRYLPHCRFDLIVVLLACTLPLAAGFVHLPTLATTSLAVSSEASSTSCPSTTSDNETTNNMKWFQQDITITAPSRGCHLITSQINKAIQKEMAPIKMGLCNLFIQHTSASLTINEKCRSGCKEGYGSCT